MNCKCDWHARLEKKKETEAEDKIVKLARKVIFLAKRFSVVGNAA